MTDHKHVYGPNGVCWKCYPGSVEIQLAPCPFWHASRAPAGVLRADPIVRCMWCGAEGPGGENPITAWNRRRIE